MTRQRWWSMPARSTTSRKLWFGFGTLTGVLILLSLAITARFVSIEGQVDEIAEARNLSATARQLEINTLGYALAVHEYVQSGRPGARQDALEEAAAVERHLWQYENFASTDRQQAMAARFAPSWDALNQLGQTLLDTPPRRLRSDTSQPDTSRFYAARIELEQLLDEEIQAEAIAAYDARRSEILADVRTITGFALVLLMVGIVIALVTGGLVGRGIMRSERELWTSRERLRVTLASIGDAVITTDTQGRVAYLNATAEALTGWRSHEAEGQLLEAVFRTVAGDTEAPVESSGIRALRQGQAVAVDHIVLVARDGTQRPIDDSAAPIRDEHGDVAGAVLIFRDASERYRVEHTLRQAREELEQRVVERTAEIARANLFLHTLLDNLQEGIVACDAEGVLTLFNRAAQEFHGLPPEPLPAERWAEHYDLFLPDGKTPMTKEQVPLFRVLRGERVHDAEMVIAPRGREPRHLLANGQLFRDAQGNVLGAIASMHDVTLRKHAEEALQRTNEMLESRVRQRTAELTEANEVLRNEVAERERVETRLRQSETRKTAMFEAALDCIITIDHEDNIIQFNAAAEHTLGYRREDMLGRKLAETIIPPAFRESHLKGIDRYLASGEAVVLDRRLELSALRADGAEIPIELTVTRIPIEGPPVFTAYLRDISDRKRAETALRASEARLRSVMDSVPQKIFTAAPSGEVNYFNPQWTAFTGLSLDQILRWGWTRIIHPDDLTENVRAWRHSIATGEPFQFEHRFLRADGEYRWHVSRALPLRDDTGAVQMWVGSNSDIHEQKQTADELQQLASALSESDRRKNEFLAMLAHELRNPLAPIRNALQILRLADGDADAVKTASEMMERQTAQMVRLVDDLLDVSRISRGTIGLRRQRVELASIIYHTVETSSPALERAGHKLTVKLPPQPVFLYADPVRLAQVFGNLLNNAGKYTEAGGRISLDAQREGDEMVVTITDSGIGISPDMLPRIFEMFTQVDQSLERSQGGLGIGLTLVKRLVELHQGSVSASSEGVGRGSRFVVRLPVLGEDTAPATEPMITGPVPAVARRVLVVDDNRDSAGSLAMFLRMIGSETHVAHDGLEAVQAAEEFRPDLVLLDIGLPKLNGYEVARGIREQPWGKAMVIVAVSGWGQEEDRRKSTDSGFDGHMVKPVDHAALLRLLNELSSAAQSG